MLVKVRIICIIGVNSEFLKIMSEVTFCHITTNCSRKTLKPPMLTFECVMLFRHRTSYLVLFLEIGG